MTPGSLATATASRARRRSMRSHLLRAFGAYAVLVALVFGAAAAMFLYLVEDRLFDQQLVDEGRELLAARRATGAWPAPHAPHLSVHVDLATLPADVRDVLAREPWRREVEGRAGRHYHVRALDTTPRATREERPAAWLLADVSDRLVVRGLRRTLLWTWLGIITGLLALALLLAWTLARRVHAPLATLATAILEDRADATALLPERAAEEVHVLSEALDASQARVAEHVARERAFTRDASHELRTPLAVMHTSTHQVLTDPSLSPTSRRLLTLSARSIAQLQRTIETLLLLARDAVPATGAVARPIRPTLEAAVLEFADALDERGLVLTLDVPRTATLPAPEPVVRLLLANLLGNVLTHAAPGPVTVTFGGGVLELRNLRRPGAPPAADERLSSRSGFGLALVHRVTAAVGLVVSTEVSATDFTVRLAPSA